jgi:hypothetical protein
LFDRGEFPSFPCWTEHIRNGDWRVAPIPGSGRQGCKSKR